MKQETHDSTEGGRLLAILLDLPSSLAKSAHMLVLKRLQEHGWQCTVLTLASPDMPKEAEWCGIKIVSISPRAVRWQAFQPLSQIRARLPRRVIEVIDWLRRPLKPLVGFPDSLAPLRHELVQHARKLHRQDEFQVVLSLYYPFTSHVVARDVARRESIPWLALTKDFYSWPAGLSKSRRQYVANRIKRSFESRILSKANAIAAVNDNIAGYLQRLLPRVTVATLAHCYDDEDFHDLGNGTFAKHVRRPSEAVERFTMASEGHRTIGFNAIGERYSNDTVPAQENIFRLVSVGKADRSEYFGLMVLFQSVGELLREKAISEEHFRLRFVGFGNDLVTDCARRAECEDVLEAIPQLPHADAIAEMKRATCLLFQQAPWGTRRRLAEYLASRRPILAFPHYPDVMSERWLSERGGAKIAHTKTEIKAAIVSWYNEFLATGEPSISVDDDFIRQCSASHRASELNQLLNACLNGRQNCTDRRVLAEGESARAISPALSPIHSATIPLADSNGTFTTQVRRPSEAVECFTTASEGRRTVGVNAIGERYSIDVQPDAAAALDGVLATFRRERSLSETLDKLLAQSQPLRRLCVVDNEHTPENLDTINRVRQNHPGTQIIYLPTPENLGNAGAWALGMEHLLTDARDQDWIVILDDNNPPEGCDELRQLLEVGISAQRDDPSLGGVGISGAHFDWSSGLLQRVGDRELTGMIPVDYLAAGFLSMYCVRVIRSVGGVLPELFFGNVEIEYGLRMRRAGHALLAHGDLWLERRRLWNRCNTDPKPSAYCRVHWQRYYRIRNYIYMMRRFGRSDLAFKWAIIQCLAKPACSFFRSPSLGWRGLVQAALATRDGFTGRLGRTVEPDKGPPRRDWTLNGELLAQSPTPIHGENWT